MGVAGAVADAVERAKALPGSRVPFSNLDKVFFPATRDHRALTKADLVLYYYDLRERILPYLEDRPLVLRRYPDGVTSDWFYQKDWPDPEDVPEWAARVPVYSASRGEAMHYLVCPGWECLVFLVQRGCIDVHPWLSRLRGWRGCDTERGLRDEDCGLDHPDLLVLDIDPYIRTGRLGRRPTEAGGEPGLDPEDWAKAVEVAQLAREALDALGLRGFVKTSGKRGLHVYVPIAPEQRYDVVRRFAKGIGLFLAKRHPELVTLRYGLRERAGKVFFDYNQNVRGKTLAAPFSVRPTPQATVSMPLAWGELARARPERYTMLTAPARLRERGDPWRGLGEPQRLPDLALPA